MGEFFLAVALRTLFGEDSKINFKSKGAEVRKR